MTLTSFLEYILTQTYSLTGNYGISIILLSFFVNLLLIPLFWITEKIQTKERTRKNAMRNDLAAINLIENRNEKYFYTLEIYKRHNYKTYYSLVGTLGLLIQVPFFLAAYWLLKDLPALENVSFGLIENLNSADHIIDNSIVRLNILPILMTLINVIGICQIRDRIDLQQLKQLIFTAFLFFFLLYSESSALLIYWATNNLLAIPKNLLFNDNTGEKSPSFNFSNLILKLRTFFDPLLIGLFLILISFLSSRFGFFYESIFTKTYLSVGFCFLLVDLFIKKSWKVLVLSPLYLVAIFCPYHSILSFIRLSILSEYVNVYVIFVSAFSVLIRNYQRSFTLEKLRGAFHPLLLVPLVPVMFLIANNFHDYDYLELILALLILGIIPIAYYTFAFMILSLKGQKYTMLITVSMFTSLYLLTILESSVMLVSTLPAINLLIILPLIFLFVHALLPKVKSFLLISTLAILFIPFIQDRSLMAVNKTAVSATENSKNNLTSMEKYMPIYSPKRKPDIFLFVYDAYMNNNQLTELYDIDNTGQEKFLIDNGFIIYPNVYTTGNHSTSSMSALLNGVDSVQYNNQRKVIAGQSMTHAVLGEAGYKTYNILSSYFTRGITTNDIKVDYVYPEIATNQEIKSFIKTLLVGKLLTTLESTVKYDQWIETKHNIITQSSHHPKFIYAHSGYPGHKPGSSKNANLIEAVKTYEKRLTMANVEMKEDLGEILSTNKEAIIIFLGDHGAWLKSAGRNMDYKQKNMITREDIQDHYSCFLAIKYPESLELKTNSIMTIQEVMPHVLSLLSQNPFQQRKVRTSSWPNCEDCDNIPMIIDGIIQYGKNKGEPLFVTE